MRPAQDRMLVCIDSDGTAFDAMQWKHELCFAPQFVRFFGLEAARQQAVDVWLHINLYTKNRGINRFKALLMALDALKDKGLYSGDTSALAQWMQSSAMLGNAALAEAIQAGQTALAPVYEWSQAVNAAIQAHGASKPFPGAIRVIAALAKRADVAVVSSANREAILAEWDAAGLLPFTHALYTQEQGNKAACIAQLLAEGYAPQRTVMIGDALADLSAAEANGIWFYPIFFGREDEGWDTLLTDCIDPIDAGHFTAEQQAAFRLALQAHLPDT